ncbi:MAG: hypothetical protein ACLQGV_12505 [Bryobacteraceae bacterium]
MGAGLVRTASCHQDTQVTAWLCQSSAPLATSDAKIHEHYPQAIW